MNISIEEATINNIDEIINLKKKIWNDLENKDWYVIDGTNKEFLIKQLENEGLILKAINNNKIIGFLIMANNLNRDSFIIKKSHLETEFDKIIRTNLRKFNKSKCQWMKDNLDDIPEDDYYNFAVYDDEILIGGATGIIEFDWYFLEELWIDEKYRNQHIGTMLIEKIEELAKNKNLTGIRMETWNFQARGFYEKNGYEVYAEIEDCPPGTIEYFLKKRLK